MTHELYELLKSDIFTDAPEYAERVKRVHQLTSCTTFADDTLEREARNRRPAKATTASGSPRGCGFRIPIWMRLESREEKTHDN